MMKRLALLAGATSIALGCSSGAAPTTNPQGESDAPADAAQARLEHETGGSWQLLRDEARASTLHLHSDRTGAAWRTPGESAARATLRFVAQYKDLFALRDADAELVPAHTATDELQMTHVRMKQIIHGVPVAGAELAAHFDADGRLTSIDTTYVPGLADVSVEPGIDEREAAAAAMAGIAARSGIEEQDLVAAPGTLVVFAPRDGGSAALAYEHRIRSVDGAAPAIWITKTDARTGAVVDAYDDLQTIEATAPGVLGDTKTFQVSQSGTGYVMTDTSRGVSIRTYTAKNAQTTPGTPVSSASLTQWDTNVTGAGAAVDAHFFAGVVFDYYKARHQRNAIDNQGTAMVSTAHFGSQYDNAAWTGDQMIYGDGAKIFKPLSASLDVVAHEFSHGVTGSTSKLQYQGQSGALNEAFSDIMGAFVEHYSKPDPVKNWQLAESGTLSGAPLRDMKDPSVGKQPDHMARYVNTQQDNGGVHVNSGIVNHAAYLMVMGGNGPTPATGAAKTLPAGIGWEKGEQVWYRANTRYFLATTNFAQAAQATLQAAKDVGLTAREQALVDCAWKAVGVTTGDCVIPADPGKPADNPAPAGQAGPASESGDGAPATPGSKKSTTQDPTAGDEGDDESTTTSPKKARSAPKQLNQASGCAAAASATSAGDAFQPGMALMLGALLRRVVRRRRSA